MATEQLSPSPPRTTPVVQREVHLSSAARREPPLWRRLLMPLASLKLTVVLLALSMFIVLAGTFAQTQVDIWEAIQTYFRINFAEAFRWEFPFIHPSALFVWIDAKLFFPPSFFPADPVFPSGLSWLSAIWPTQGAIQNFPNWLGCWFPRGWTIGVVMFANLLAAHLLRFKLQARGGRLATGVVVLLGGLAVTYGVIATHNHGLASASILSYDVLWSLLNLSLFAAAAACVYQAATTVQGSWSVRLWWMAGAALIGAVGGIGVSMGTPAPESMRILYQLIKGLLAALGLLAGCWLLFKKRAGIVLLHGGVGLLMAYEVLVGTQHVEMQMVISEGERTNFAHDSRDVELAVIDVSNPDAERHVVVSSSLLKAGNVIHDDHLPFDVEVLKWFDNALPAPMRGAGEAVPTAGIGKGRQLMEQEKSVGTDSRVNFPGAYVRLLKKGTGSAASRDLGVYLLSTANDPALKLEMPGLGLVPYVEHVEIPSTATTDGKSSTKPERFDLALRFVRHYKPYEMELVDFQKNDYAGTMHARDFRSIVNMYGVDGQKLYSDHHIWMNNPLRSDGETFYQSEYRPDAAKPTTILQVVQNEGWMAPYVACMIVAVGMFFQFGMGMSRFVGRLGRESFIEAGTLEEMAYQSSPPVEAGTPPPSGLRQWVIPAGVAMLVLLTLAGYAARQRTVVKDDFQLSAFADLPVVWGGRSLPLESIAMMRLMQISDLQSFKEQDPDPTDNEKPKSQPASKWLLDMIARPELADQYPVFRIENDTLATSLGLEITPSRRYAYADFEAKLPELRKQMAGISSKPKSDRTVEERKRVELLTHVSEYLDVRSWFSSLEPTMRQDFPQLFAEGQSRLQRANEVLDMVRRLSMFAEDSKEFRVPLVIPMHIGEAEGSLTRFEKINRRWESFPVATGFQTLDRAMEAPSPPAVGQFEAILTAWKKQDAQAFNSAVADYRELLASASAEDLTVSNTQVSLAKGAFEGYYDRVGAFNLLSFSYLVVLLLSLAGWGASGFRAIGKSRLLQRSALFTAVGLFVLHTVAIVARIYISGRPPVTNLYSSAIFIGWGAVLLGILFEVLFKLGIGNAVAALAGFASLRIAHALMSDGDTLGVVEAVLDTQFWLATHVVCITLGYAATYVAGLLGILYIVLPAGPETRKMISRMTYGTICGATFLSFVGTVLGGLWADDSWGRFWGWDPKENGALVIVLWNALILHARWDGMIRDRGMAMLAVLGNIVTSWSWFGVNELGIGLHTYGFTEGRLFWLMVFCLSQFAIVVVGGLRSQSHRNDHG
ncbi:MAG: cytochrome c biogenesis protein, partial [Planctomycetaceae bacterium]